MFFIIIIFIQEKNTRYQQSKEGTKQRRNISKKTIKNDSEWRGLETGPVQSLVSNHLMAVT